MTTEPPTPDGTRPVNTASHRAHTSLQPVGLELLEVCVEASRKPERCETRSISSLENPEISSQPVNRRSLIAGAVSQSGASIRVHVIGVVALRAADLLQRQLCQTGNRNPGMPLSVSLTAGISWSYMCSSGRQFSEKLPWCSSSQCSSSRHSRSRDAAAPQGAGP
ncbi:hypothetical protein EYF80_044677 [Liparis tanakae]|uniref:Uncharacterized protein n=1 Tax=Liparis tanakae TaxID=230148 RepID=A0A4Z2FV79_9TELE|nr:hypothetical protein EYF80_044677 [Liparis tanakae]